MLVELDRANWASLFLSLVSVCVAPKVSRELIPDLESTHMTCGFHLQPEL